MWCYQVQQDLLLLSIAFIDFLMPVEQEVSIKTSNMLYFLLPLLCIVHYCKVNIYQAKTN